MFESCLTERTTEQRAYTLSVRYTEKIKCSFKNNGFVWDRDFVFYLAIV